MQEIKICVGSCCFSQDASKIIELFKENHEIEDFELLGSFCLGKCGKGVTVKIDDKIYKIKTIEELEKLLKDYRTKNEHNHNR